MTSSIITISALALSIICNGLLVWYIRRLIIFVDTQALDMEAVKGDIKNYEEHLEKVYGLETFYGDSTLQELLKHTKYIREEIVAFIKNTDKILSNQVDTAEATTTGAAIIRENND
tara:strand:+ start:2111 stop:2458 length:348 start_codon:yes stop_codon:yes gene_type:complete